jgi:hypothetical protein
VQPKDADGVIDVKPPNECGVEYSPGRLSISQSTNITIRLDSTSSWNYTEASIVKKERLVERTGRFP